MLQCGSGEGSRRRGTAFGFLAVQHVQSAQRSRFLQDKADQGNEVALAVLRSRKEAMEPEQAAPVKDWSQHGQARAEFAAKERAVLEMDGISGKGKSRLQSVLRMEQVVGGFQHHVDRMRPIFCKLLIRSPFCSYMVTKLCLGVQYTISPTS